MKTTAEQILAAIGAQPGNVIRVTALRLECRHIGKSAFFVTLDQLRRDDRISLNFVRGAGIVRMVTKVAQAAVA